MSAYICNDETISVVADIIAKSMYEPHTSYVFAQKDYSQEPHLQKAIGQDLLELNYLAVNARYGNEAGTAHAFRYKPIEVSPIQQIKALQCFIYQCSEDKADKTVLFEDLTKLEEHLVFKFLSELPEYKKATWGIEECRSQCCT